MKFKSYSISIWFLDDNLQKSSEYLTNKALTKSIDGCFNSMISTYFYFIGIRNNKFYKYFFSKDHVQETKDKFFPNWPLKNNPSFSSYNSKCSKWCRKCKEHYDYLKKYLSILLDEYEFRFGKEHGLKKFIEWESLDMPSFNFPEAHLKKLYVPWKVLNPRYRQKNIIDGYKLQFVNSFEDNDPYVAYSGSKRDIPDFVIKHFNLGISLES